jgi:hypothetical protein
MSELERAGWWQSGWRRCWYALDDSDRWERVWRGMCRAAERDLKAMKGGDA